MSSIVLTEVSERVGYITINRPEKRNALGPELVQSLRSAFDLMEVDQSVKVIVLKANGKVFCAGADLDYIRELQNFSFGENLADSNNLKELFLTIYNHPKPVIAQVHGHALAGGCGLATVCDFVFTVPEANFGYTEVRIGFIPALVMVFLLRKIGETKAKEILLSGNLINGYDTLKYGIANYVVELNELNDKVLNFAQQLIENNSAASMALTKQMISKVQDMNLEDALDFAAKRNAEARASDDCKKGIASFLNKDKLIW